MPSVVIHCWDRYDWCWEDAYFFFNKFWDWTLDWPVYFLTGTKEVDFPNVECIKCGDYEWTYRLKNGLNQIKDDYILYFQEDMWLNKPVDGALMLKLFDLFIDHDMDAFRLMENGRQYKTGQTPNGILKFDRKSDYLICHQPSFWKKQFFLDNLKIIERPKENEVNGTKRLRGRKDLKIYLYPMQWYTHMIRRGKYITEHFNEMEGLR